MLNAAENIINVLLDRYLQLACSDCFPVNILQINVLTNLIVNAFFPCRQLKQFNHLNMCFNVVA